MCNKKIIYELFMACLALITCFFIAVQELYILNEETIYIINIIDNIIWGIFVADYFIRLLRAKDKMWFLKNNKIDLISIIPFNSIFKSLRILKVTRIIKITKLTKITKLLKFTAFLLKFKNRFEKFIHTNNFNYVLYITLITVLLGAVGISFAENKPFSDSLWWSFVTTTTVGYGDISPETGLGRIIASILMLVGIGFVGMLTGTIATYFLNYKSNPKTYKEEVIQSIKEKLDDFDSLSEEDIKDLYNVLLSLKN